ncbi:MAG: hypothetical protein II031_01400, partial [Bacteroidales bacterium]|nr:hypothetical protein [Bacteroidales bacterium]
MNRLRLIAFLAAALFPGLLACAQGLPDTTVKWETEVVTGEDGTSRIVFTGTPVVPLDQVHGTLQWISCVGESCHSPEELEYDLHPSAAGTGRSQGVPPETHATLGTVRGGTVSEANGGVERSETVSGGTTLTDGPIQSKGKSLWGLILEAILWGFAMLLTPCVFPMVPMTVSFFVKGNENPARGKFKALMYGLFIVLLYTVPISIIIGLT